jgi:hypothetical protein
MAVQRNSTATAGAVVTPPDQVETQGAAACAGPPP